MSSSFASESVNILVLLKDSLSDKNDIDKKTLDLTYFIDLKSTGLRDILRTVLREIRIANLNDDKPSVWLPSFSLCLPLT